MTTKEVAIIAFAGAGAAVTGLCVGGVIIPELIARVLDNPKPVETPISPAMLATLTPVAELPVATGTLPVATQTPWIIERVVTPTPTATKAATKAALNAVDLAVASLKFPGITTRQQFLDYFGIDSDVITIDDVRLCTGETSGCVEVPVKKLANGQVRQFDVTNPTDKKVDGYVCGNTDRAQLPKNKTVCAEGLVVRDANLKPAATPTVTSGDSVEAAIQGLSAGIKTRQDFQRLLGITGLDLGRIELCPKEPNCVRVPIRYKEGTNEVQSFMMDPQVDPSILFDGYRCPFKIDNKWADNRQRQGVPHGPWCVEDLTVRWADFNGRTVK